MATTRLMPLHTGKGRNLSTAIADIIDYVKNPQRRISESLSMAMSATPGLLTQNFFYPNASMPA